MHQNLTYLLEVLSWVQRPPNGTAVYCILSHAGLYIGKANLRRSQPGSSGLAARCVEHLIGLFFVRSRDGSLGRYKVLRQSAASATFLPLQIFTSESRALSVERLLISYLAPSANGADQMAGYMAGTKKQPLRASKANRRRPPLHVRGSSLPKHMPSIWDQLHFKVGMHKAEQQPGNGSSISWPKLPFGRLYRHIQLVAHSRLGVVGPLPVFGDAHYHLFLSWAATRTPRIFIPRGWRRWQVAKQVYGAAQQIDKFLASCGLRTAARAELEKVLRRFQLPPLCVRPLVVHPILLSKLGQIRKLVKKALDTIVNGYAQQWLLQHLQVVPGKKERWQDQVNCKQIFARFKRTDFLKKPAGALGLMAQCRSLRAHQGAWRLPKWPSRKQVIGNLRSVWKSWSASHRLPLSATRAGKAVLESYLSSLQIPVCPGAWATCEVAMQKALAAGGCVTRDDKVPNKVWTSNAGEMVAATLQGIVTDPAWKVHPWLSVHHLSVMGYVRGSLGVPWFLRSHRRHVSTRPPCLFAFVKSKCFSDTGEKVCQKDGHSCMRRVVDDSAIPYRGAWRVLGRGIRGVLEALQGREIFNPSVVAPVLEKSLLGLSCTSSVCLACGRAMVAPLTVVVADVDQAFECCDAVNVLRSWTIVATEYQRGFGTSIQVKKGKRYGSRPGDGAWTRGWWKLSLSELGAALASAASGTYAALGDLVLELQGMCIGGPLSSAAVSTRFFAEEFQSTIPADRLRWHRYVDDVLGFSRCLCGGCVEKHFRGLFAEPLSTVFNSDTASTNIFEWLHLEFCLQGAHLTWSLKNQNRSFFYQRDNSKFRSNFVAWPGALPLFFKQLRGLFISKDVAATDALVSYEGGAVVLLELVLELLSLGYPVSLLRCIVHSLPKSPAALLTRKVVRAYLKLCKIGHGGDSRGDGRKSGGKSGGSNGRSGPRHSYGGESNSYHARGREDRRRTSDPKKSRSSSSSSSSGSSKKRERKLAKARKLLADQDTNYKAFAVAQQERIAEESFRRQGEVLAAALNTKLIALMLEALGRSCVSDLAGHQSSSAAFH